MDPSEQPVLDRYDHTSEVPAAPGARGFGPEGSWGPGPEGSWGPGPYGPGPYGPGGSWGGYPPGPPPGHLPEQSPPPAPGRHGLSVLAVAMVVFVSSALGFGLAARYRAGSAVLPQQASGSPSTAPGSVYSGSSDGSVAAGTAPSAQAAAIAAKVKPGVVDIYTTLGYQNGAAAGTGMVLTSTGEILTNDHVVSGATSIRVTVVGTGRSYTAQVVGNDPAHDVAVLQLQGASGLKTVSTGDASKVAVGDAVVTLGNAYGAGGTPSVKTGTVVAVDQTIVAGDSGGGGAERLTGLLQTSAALQPGDSGGPLVNAQGQVIGMDTAASSSFRFQAASGVSFAIPINTALGIAKQIESGKASSTIHIGASAFLGLQLRSSATGSGALVAGVQPGTPAEAAGLTAGDTITAIDGTTVDSPSTLTTALGAHHPGDKVTVHWTDAMGQSHAMSVTLATGPVR